MSGAEVPAGYLPLTIASAYLRAQGDFFVRTEVAGASVGLRVAPHQINTNGSAHGGLIATLVDVAMSVAVLQDGQTSSTSTVHMSLDYAAPVGVGQWLSAHAEVYRRTPRMAFVQCRISGDETPSGHASGVFRYRTKNHAEA